MEEGILKKNINAAKIYITSWLYFISTAWWLQARIKKMDPDIYPEIYKEFESYQVIFQRFEDYRKANYNDYLYEIYWNLCHTNKFSASVEHVHYPLQESGPDAAIEPAYFRWN